MNKNVYNSIYSTSLLRIYENKIELLSPIQVEKKKEIFFSTSSHVGERMRVCTWVHVTARFSQHINSINKLEFITTGCHISFFKSIMK